MGTDRNNSNVMENVDKFGKTNKDTSRRDFADKQNPGDKWSRSNEDHIQSLGQNADSNASDRSKGTSERGPTQGKGSVYNTGRENENKERGKPQNKETSTIY